MAQKYFMVVYDNEMEACYPYGLSDYCDGGLDPGNHTPALFTTKQAAQRAIRVSRAYTRLLQEQGVRNVIDDFTAECRHCIKIITAIPVEESPST